MSEFSSSGHTFMSDFMGEILFSTKNAPHEQSKPWGALIG